MSNISKSFVSLTMPSFEDYLDDGLSSFRIPPLKSMFPSPSSERPMALEPSTTLSMDEQTSKLTGRQMALAQAKSMEDLKPGEFEAVDPAHVCDSEPPKLDPLEEHNKKRRKLAHQEQVLDFVHLPRPKPKPKLDEKNNKPFQPIAVVNQLNEPPPSAALFPPITPSQEEHPFPASTGDAQNGDIAAQGKTSQRRESDKMPGKRKRNYTRGPRRKWTEEESNDLTEGVAICGVGRWKDILSHPKFHFHESRTHVDLKDRFRTLYPQHRPEKWAVQTGQIPAPIDLSLRSTRTNRKRKFTGKRKLYQSWTDGEDVELYRGFEKHGYNWHLIAQDESLQLEQRSANQIRDRFRRLYPDTYEQPAPAPSPKKPKTKTGPDKQGRGRDKTDAADKYSEQARVGAKKAPTFPSRLLNRDADEEESEFTQSLAALDNDLRLPPLQWDDMAVQPMFDLG